MSPSRSRSALVAVTALVVTGLTGPAAAASPEPARGARCLSREYTEPQLKNLQNVDLADPKVGQLGIYHDELVDDRGAYRGTIMGRYEVKAKTPRGAVLTHYTEDIFLTDGIVHAEGVADFRDVLAGRWISYRAIGVDGVYKGLSGRREWRVIVPDEPVDARITVCG
ncbi:hypothetical protein V5P93_003874 [Actinokineospora auranticolor]|uniref:Allene oxide cyclase barrel-like domain-containing protein n=1 Tax=Actinokineospora auranticolor TaxID=155976 RepID=A0A2S6GLP7_9PSEU|nr:hypothetical protein [Actinokineospora auranticolor]PPK66159.1 hypothetical protein CLV40_111123 [Actinokineospora auranticolor]